jgi:hypothetical protein
MYSTQDDDRVPILVWTIADHAVSRLSSWRARDEKRIAMPMIGAVVTSAILELPIYPVI